METPFREGPWRAEDDDGLPCIMASRPGRDAVCIATVNPFEHDYKATLAAITALPALYEALYRLTKEAKLDGMDKRAGWDAWVSMAEAALRAARGEQGEG